jgi:hypothetical protein
MLMMNERNHREREVVVVYLIVPRSSNEEIGFGTERKTGNRISRWLRNLKVKPLNDINMIGNNTTH